MLTRSFPYKIRLDDLDFMQHVGHAQWLLLFERARTDLMEAIDYPTSELFRDGLGVIVARANVEFKRPAHLGDIVDIQLSCEKSSRTSIRAAYVAHSRKEDMLLVSGELILVFVGQGGRPVDIPNQVLSHLVDARTDQGGSS